MQVPVVVKVVVTLVVIGALGVVGLVAAWVFNPAWDNCASYVGGRLVEHDCSETPSR